MIGSPVLLDVNVPMYAAGQPHPYRAACAWVMAEIARGQLVAAIDAETIQEILHRYGSLQQWQIGIRMATQVTRLAATVYPITPNDTHQLIQLCGLYASRGLRVRDLLHAAVMLNNGLAEIISTDRHFDLIPGLTRLDPQALYQAAGGPGGP